MLNMLGARLLLVPRHRQALALALGAVLFAVIVVSSCAGRTAVAEGFLVNDRPPAAAAASLTAIVINLRRRPGRLESFLELYDRSDLATDVRIATFEAVDSLTLDMARFVAPAAMEQLADAVRTGTRVRHSDLSPGAVGCFLSHVSVARMLLQDDQHGRYLVLEDDVRVPGECAAAVRAAVAEVEQEPAGWDALLLGHLFARPTFESGVHACTSFWGTQAYVITREGARRVVDDFEANRIAMQIDWTWSRLSARGQLRMFAVARSIFNQTGSDSDIQTSLRIVPGVDPYSLPEPGV